MSKEHTQGRMTWKRRPDKSLLYVIGDHKAGAHAQGDIYIGEADLRRLAACWNACDGLTTENLELCGTLDHADVKRNVAQTAYVNDLQTQRDQLLEALRICEGKIKSLLESSGYLIVYAKWFDDVQAAIAKATKE